MANQIEFIVYNYLLSCSELNEDLKKLNEELNKQRIQTQSKPAIN